MARKKAQASGMDIPFNDKLLLFRYFLSLFGKDKLSAVAGVLNSADYEGLNESQNTRFFSYLDTQAMLHPDDFSITRDKLRSYDENICRHVKQIGEKRGGLTLKYFQYMALLFTEVYLDRYFDDCAGFAAELNTFAQAKSAETMGQLEVTSFTPDSMNKLAYMCATGSGKTLLMHINILQFLHYRKRAERNGKRCEINKIIVLAPNEGMSRQHYDELQLSSIKADLFMKDVGFVTTSRDTVIIIDMNKLKEEGKKKTVSVDSFEQNNLVLVDEAHRGLSGDVWYDYRTRLSQDGGFAFEYSATFKQALRSAKASDRKAQQTLDEYMKSIIMDYSYKFFYEDGYGKDYRIYNLREGIDVEQKQLYLTGCLLSFYQQVKLYEQYRDAYKPFMIERPLLVFVGNRVTAKTDAAELTDVEEVLSFIDQFVRNRAVTIGRIQSVLDEDTGLIDASGHELFYSDFEPLKQLWSHRVAAADVYADMLHIVFNTDTVSDELRLHVENLKQADGEIGLRIGEDGDYFGVINVGDTAALIKNCEQKGIVSRNEEFSSGSLFRSINDASSRIHMLIGSRKFTEGWNSWRVSTMGLINFAKGEGSQAIQLFGRGVRLHGYHGCLKRSTKLDSQPQLPPSIRALETLTIFGIKAQYMEDFKQYLELEDMPTGKTQQYKLPVISRKELFANKNLRVIRLPEGVSFKKQAARLSLHAPDEGLLGYLVKNRSVIDCRSKVQTIESHGSYAMHLESTTQEYMLPPAALPFLDYERAFAELEQYKNEKALFNLSIEKNAIKPILETDGWYALIIPKAHILFDSMEKIELFTDFAISALKIYIDKFCKYYREQWEAPRMKYLPMQENDTNFVSEYTFSYTPDNSGDHYGDEIEAFLKELGGILERDGGISDYEKKMSHSVITAFDFRRHLYAPLISVAGQGLKVTVSPVSLNSGEKTFVDMLRKYCDDYPATLRDAEMYLLRNKSKVGMGFFEAGNFYPDYVLWIDKPDVQLITFVDPKGLMNIRPDNPKISFYKTIKELEDRLQPSSEKRIVLNSFIMSDTKSADLGLWWGMNKREREEHHVMCLDSSDCVENMMAALLQ